MKQIHIPENLFNKILKGCKGSVATDMCRPELQFIRIEVAKQSITAYSLDGFRASKIVIPRKEEAEEEFIAYIRPFTLKELKTGKETVLLGMDGEAAFVDFKTTHGRTRYTFDVPKPWSVEIENIFKVARESDRKIGVNAMYLSGACKAIGAVVEDRNNLAVLESSDNPIKAFLLRGKGEGFTIDQLILPIRMVEGV